MKRFCILLLSTIISLSVTYAQGFGYDSKTDLDFVKERLDISKAYSSTLAYEVRSLLTQFMHDAIWVQKTHNMLPILDELNNRVIEQAEKGFE